jgi:ketosteroid isomerase-like protein
MSDEFATEGLRSFFGAFERENAAADVEALARLYAPSILVAGPNGSQVVSRDDLLRAIPKRKQMFETAGHRSTKLAALQETKLDDRYTLARTEWRWQFDAPAELTVPSTFIVDRSGTELRIVLYMMHHDIARLLKDHGLISAP